MAHPDDVEPASTDAVARAQVWSGPIPPLAVLESFERAVPGLARVLVDEFTAEAKHRREIEARTFRADAASELLGQGRRCSAAATG